jgi:hypothetical protein
MAIRPKIIERILLVMAAIKQDWMKTKSDYAKQLTGNISIF